MVINLLTRILISCCGEKKYITEVGQ
jgi:hypothetical protein